ncbi:MAG: hypothetical protein ACOYM2_07060 [Rectinemataceae bacterium]
MGEYLILVAIDIAGLMVIWFVLKARVRKSLELDGLLAEARKEVRLLNLELNETTERNISLIEDRLSGLREAMAEADRRLGLLKREAGKRQAETEVYSRLGRRAAIVQADVTGLPSDLDSQTGTLSAGQPAVRSARTMPDFHSNSDPADSVGGYAGESVQLPPGGAVPARAMATEPEPPVQVPPRHPEPDPPSRRERVLGLHRNGFSADIIASKVGATIAEVELLISLDEGRRGQGAEARALNEGWGNEQ